MQVQDVHINLWVRRMFDSSMIMSNTSIDNVDEHVINVVVTLNENSEDKVILKTKTISFSQMRCTRPIKATITT